MSGDTDPSSGPAGTWPGRMACPLMTTDAALEILRPDLPRGRFRAVLFDFDGTLSLLREGWPAVMTELMVEELRKTGARHWEEGRFAAIVEAIVVGLNGRPTIVQMQHLAAEVR